LNPLIPYWLVPTSPILTLNVDGSEYTSICFVEASNTIPPFEPVLYSCVGEAIQPDSTISVADFVPNTKSLVALNTFTPRPSHVSPAEFQS
jgi:hypothetical protein